MEHTDRGIVNSSLVVLTHQNSGSTVCLRGVIFINIKKHYKNKKNCTKNADFRTMHVQYLVYFSADFSLV